jgi:hypothetical protein
MPGVEMPGGAPRAANALAWSKMYKPAPDCAAARSGAWANDAAGASALAGGTNDCCNSA